MVVVDNYIATLHFELFQYIICKIWIFKNNRGSLVSKNVRNIFYSYFENWHRKPACIRQMINTYFRLKSLMRTSDVITANTTAPRTAPITQR